MTREIGGQKANGRIGFVGRDLGIFELGIVPRILGQNKLKRIDLGQRSL